MKPDKVVLNRFKQVERGIVRLRAAIFTRKITGSKVIEPEPFEEWATQACHLLQEVCGDSVHYRYFNQHKSKFKGYASTVEQCIGVFKAAKKDYKKGNMAKIHSLVSAEVIDDVLEQAEELLKAKYAGPACVVVGVALETTLKKLCDINSIPHAKLDKMNADIVKIGIYNVGIQKQITAWAHWRNEAAHGNWNSFSEQDVTDMIKGVRRFITEYI